jgi:hypothetical protein
MTGPDHYSKSEELTAKAHDYLGQGQGQDSAAVWAAAAQIHATLALAAANALGTTAADGRAWAEALVLSSRRAPLDAPHVRRGSTRSSKGLPSASE